ncbi:MAG: TolC family protein [Rickettsiaceae bacterium]|nr:TolC family protein [Rickettsiaceae bacterium]
MKVLVKKKYMILVATVFSLEASAISLLDAMSMAYRQNPKIKASQEEYIASIQKFPETLSENFLPDVRYYNQDQRNSTKIKDDPTGYPVTKKSMSRGIQMKQSLFAGGSGITSLNAARYQVDAAKIKYISSEQEFLLEGIKTYVAYIAAQEKFDSSKAYVISTQRQYEAELEKMKVGQSTSTDVASTKAQYSRALYENAKNMASLSTTQSAFKAFFSTEPADLKLPNLPENLPSSFDIFKTEALAANLNIKSYSAQMKAQKNAVRANQGKLLPSIDLTLSTTENLSSQFNNAGASFPLKTRSNSATVAIDIPILSRGGAEHSRIRAEKAKLRTIAYNLDNINNVIEAQLISHWEDLESTKLALKFAEEELSARKLAYEGLKSSFEVGLSTLLEVLEAEKNLYQSKSNMVETNQALIIAAYTIKSDLAQLTAKSLGLGAKLFDPDLEFRKTKIRIIGF